MCCHEKGRKEFNEVKYVEPKNLKKEVNDLKEKETKETNRTNRGQNINSEKNLIVKLVVVHSFQRRT